MATDTPIWDFSCKWWLFAAGFICGKVRILPVTRFLWSGLLFCMAEVLINWQFRQHFLCQVSVSGCI